MIQPFQNGSWFKGNLHCHSTVSDGYFNRDELVKLYREQGYSFLSFSEHELFTADKNYNSSDFIIIPAIERSVYVPDSHKCFHIHGIGGEISDNTPMQVEPWEGIQSVQSVINQLKAAGSLVMLNHPLWSMNELEDLLQLDFDFLEIYNHGCEVENKSGLANVYWDSLLKRGRAVKAMATDDNHNRHPFGDAPHTWDSFGGWISVKTSELTEGAIYRAIKNGSYYASSGPEIYDFRVQDGKAFVECSPVERIYFLTYENRGFSRCGNGITSAEFELGENVSYLRVECQDKDGKTAWTNPVFLSY